MAAGLPDLLREFLSGIDPARLRHLVETLPAPRHRDSFPDKIREAERMIAETLEEEGWSVERRPFVHVNSGAPTGEFCPDAPERSPFSRLPPVLSGTNILAVRRGRRRQEAVLVGAHYDTVPNSPGANDNGASVAALLVLAGLLGRLDPERTLLLAAFDREEGGLVGSRALVPDLAREYAIRGAVVFETMGSVRTGPRTQSFPVGAGLLYPRAVGRIRRRGSPGDFTAVIHRRNSREVARLFREGLAFLTGEEKVVQIREPGDLPVVGPLLRTFLPDLPRQFARRDHQILWEEGVPAIMVTDTANFRYEHYHRPSDTPEKVDYQRIAAIVSATATLVLQLATGPP
ncbi:MAG: peptidase, M28 family [Leptospirillum sp. Group IV 'UBA BS']|nr:MAG: peptidase, M28 family [Leptospirillum sp. Group IV 'UBA BS']